MYSQNAFEFFCWPVELHMMLVLMIKMKTYNEKFCKVIFEKYLGKCQVGT